MAEADTTASMVADQPHDTEACVMDCVDCGMFPDGADAAVFECGFCKFNTGWIYADQTEWNNGIVCPHCSGEVSR